MQSSAGDGSSLRLLLIQNLPILLLAAAVYYLYNSYYAGGLNRYPGPFLAKFGKLWHTLDVLANKHQAHLTDLHRRHGDVVRIGPTTLSVSNPEYVSKVFGVSAGFRKSDMYDVFAPRINGKVAPSLLSARDPKVHAAFLRPMAKEFAMTMMTNYEPLIDKTIQKWISTIDEKVCSRPDKSCDMALWLRCFTQETIMDVTFSESMGFLDAGGDVGGFLEAMNKNVDSAGLQAPMPWTAYIVKHNPIVAKFRPTNTRFPEWTVQRISARLKARADGKVNGVAGSGGDQNQDFLDRFLDAAPSSEPPGYDFNVVMAWCLVNILAGGDTTAIALSSIVYHLLKNPEKQVKLVRELRDSQLSTPVSWKDCQALPYLDACVREGFRLRPSVGLGLERDVGGLRMPDGYVLPAEARVSMNAYVINRQTSVFGDDVEDFVPERWLKKGDESDVEHGERTKRMKSVDLNFSFGAHSCTGKHLASMVAYKATASLFHQFDINLVDPSEEWTTVNRWLARCDSIHCKVRRPQ